jgi:hemolysin III
MIVSNFPSSTRPERIADGAIHAFSLVLFVIASVFLIQMSAQHEKAWLLAATVIYVFAGLASLLVSFAYHLSAWHHWRLTLRRWDHAAIYLVIAAVFSPLLILCDTWSAYAILVVIWLCAAVGLWFKLVAGAVESRWSLFSYIAMGCLSFVALPDFWEHLPKLTTKLVGAGGLFYLIGTAFYRRKAMRFRYPVWHIWGTCGGFSFFTAIWVAMAG